MSKIKAVPAATLPKLSIATLSMYDVNATANKLVEPNDYTRKPIVYYPSYESSGINVITVFMIEKCSKTQLKVAVFPAGYVSVILLLIQDVMI
jgi:hypothetical protein